METLQQQRPGATSRDLEQLAEAGGKREMEGRGLPPGKSSLLQTFFSTQNNGEKSSPLGEPRGSPLAFSLP